LCLRKKFEISDAEEPSYRIVGGTATLIEKLVAEVGIQNIKTQTKVTAKEVDNQLEVTGSDHYIKLQLSALYLRIC
jgi:monoamine oxidase